MRQSSPQGQGHGLLGSIWIWSRKRPMVGAIILALGGWAVMNPMVGVSFQMLVRMGMRGAAPYLLGGIMMLAAVIAVIVPGQRHFPAVIASACAVLSLPFANLGGWLIGMLLGIIGAGMVFAWTPYTDRQLAIFADRAARKAARRGGHRPAPGAAA